MASREWLCEAADLPWLTAATQRLPDHLCSQPSGPPSFRVCAKPCGSCCCGRVREEACICWVARGAQVWALCTETMVVAG